MPAERMALPAAWRAALGRLLRYGLVGGGMSLLFSALVAAMVWLGLDPVLASALAFMLVLIPGFLAHRAVTFGDRARHPAQISRFFITNASAFCLAIGGMYAITHILHLSYVYGIVWNFLAIPLVNYGILSVWVFRARQAASAWERER